jgi:hypothetical protein
LSARSAALSAGSIGIDPDAPEEPDGEEEPVEDDKEFHVKKGKK